MMGKKRNLIDWETIEKAYRIGQVSIREIARQHDIQASSITRRAKKGKWQRDHTDEIRQRTRATLLQRNKKNNKPTPEDIEIAVQTNVEIVRQHRKIIERTMAFANRLLDTAEAKEIDTKVDNRVFLSITQGLAKVIPLERQSFNLDEPSKDGAFTLKVVYDEPPKSQEVD